MVVPKKEYYKCSNCGGLGFLPPIEPPPKTQLVEPPLELEPPVWLDPLFPFPDPTKKY
jgi:hypothetical protein